MIPDLTKLKRAIMFVCDFCRDKPSFGSTHLNKILYYADFEHYKYTGRSITDAEYFKLPHGPAPRHMIPAIKQLIDEGVLDIKETPLMGYTQKRPTPLTGAAIPEFEGLENELLVKYSERACSVTSNDLSKGSHEHTGWALADLKEEIPYHTIHCTGVNPITEDSRTWASELARSQGII